MEDRDLFVDQLCTKLRGLSRGWIEVIVIVIQCCIFEEIGAGMGVLGGDVSVMIEDISINFLNEIKKMFEDPQHYRPIIYLQMDTGYMSDLHCLMSGDREDLTTYAEEEFLPLDDNNLSTVPAATRMIFEIIREATLRGLSGEKTQTQKVIAAEISWGKHYADIPTAADADSGHRGSVKQVSWADPVTVVGRKI